VNINPRQKTNAALVTPIFTALNVPSQQNGS
jgi:hypothetical protein